MSGAFEAKVQLARPRPTRALAVALLAALAIGWALTTGAFHAPGLLAVLVLFAGMGVTAALRRPARGGRVRSARADAAGLHVDGKLVVPRDDLRGALVSEVDAGPEGGAVVHLDVSPRWRAWSVFTRTRDEADALVLALGLGHPDDRVRLRALPPWARHIRWLTVLLTTSPWFLFNVVRFVPPWGVLVLAGLYGLIALPLVVPQTVEVAADGVLVTWLGSKTFLPFRTLAHADASSVGVVLRTYGGREHEIRLTQQDGARDVERDALLARIAVGIARHREAARGTEEALLARGGRTVPAWMAEMEAMGVANGGDGGYRAAAIPRERLWAVLEDPTASASARAGAAMALHAGAQDDDGLRARLAAVASRTAAPSLRVTLDLLDASQNDDASRTRVRVALEGASAEAELQEAPEAQRGRSSS